MSTESQTVASNVAEEAAVLVDERPGVLVVTINRPHAKNAVTLAVSEGIAAARTPSTPAPTSRSR